MSDKEVTSELLSSVCEGAGYNEVFLPGRRLEEYSPRSPKREPSIQSLSNEIEEDDDEDTEDYYDEGEGDVVEEVYEEDCEEEKDEDEGKDDERSLEGGSLGSLRDGRTCLFILLAIWIINDFNSVMTTKIFKNLGDHYQIPKNVPIYLPWKFEKCYFGKTTDVGMYEAMFARRLRLPLMELHCQLANFLGFSISQIAPNAWRIFIRAKVHWGPLSGGNRRLTLDKFFYCYRPQHISLSQEIYHFTARKTSLRLVSYMPDSNRNWKNMNFFVQGTDWVCRWEELVTMPYGFDNT